MPYTHPHTIRLKVNSRRAFFAVAGDAPVDVNYDMSALGAQKKLAEHFRRSSASALVCLTLAARRTVRASMA